MTDIVIRAEGIGKRYRIGQPQHSRALRDVIAQAWSGARKRNGQTSESILWALKNVGFSIERGQAVAIVGRNGSGKSTLLKILSRITEPTEGTAEIHGRVGSLLEVGTGFHSELTGRENVYLNGAILGMTKREINRKFDEIVAFSEIERFLDTPVKHYSSGMFVRLAFAVAAHMEPEILLVDEVLAVGDAAFQKKCLGKMGDVAEGGRTVLFVSHNTQAVSQLCERAIWLDRGQVVGDGPARQVLEQYLSPGSARAAEVSWKFPEAPGSQVVKLRSVRVFNGSDQPSFDVNMDEPIRLQAEFWLLRQANIELSFDIFNQDGTFLFKTGNFHDGPWRVQSKAPGLYSCSCVIPGHLLNEGPHSFGVFLRHGTQSDLKMRDVASFHVHDRGKGRAGWGGRWRGAVRPILPWTGQRVGDLP